MTVTWGHGLSTVFEGQKTWGSDSYLFLLDLSLLIVTPSLSFFVGKNGDDNMLILVLEAYCEV